MIDEDYSEREIGWLITKDHDRSNYSTSRVGWGQLRVHADETDRSFDNMVRLTVFMDKSLTEHMIPDAEKVRWRCFDDDGNPYYDGIVSIHWLMGDDLAYNIDRFVLTDVGAIHVYYSADDITDCAERFNMKDWERLASTSKSSIGNHKQVPISDSGAWIEIYC